MSDNFDRQAKNFVEGITDDVVEASVVLLKEQKVPEKSIQVYLSSIRQVIEASFMKRYKGIRSVYDSKK